MGDVNWGLLDPGGKGRQETQGLKLFPREKLPFEFLELR